MKGYLTVVEAKLLQLVSETFCSFPTDNANFCYLDRLLFGALATQCKPEKKKWRSYGGGSTASPMIKSAKIQRGRRRKFTQFGLHTSYHGDPPDL